MILRKSSRPSHSNAYAAWMTAAADAHRTGSEDLKAKAERLYIEMKHIEKRTNKTAARMNRN